MKHLFLTSILFLTSLLVTAQESFNGMWLNEGSDYIKTILASEYEVLSVCNTSFEEYKVLNEVILEEGTTSFLTNLYNKENGYKVTIEYTLISTDTISTTYSGDLEGTYILTRLYQSIMPRQQGSCANLIGQWPLLFISSKIKKHLFNILCQVLHLHFNL